MTQEDKELLCKDLCARLPYGVKAQIYNHWRDEVQDETITIENLHQLIETFSIGDIKPYLFPLSSMTEEQMEELKKLCTMYIPERFNFDDYHPYAYRGIKVLYKHVDYNYKFDFKPDVIDWFNKNHFDYRGLIPMGLAIDATGLNIY